MPPPHSKYYNACCFHPHHKCCYTWTAPDNEQHLPEEHSELATPSLLYNSKWSCGQGCTYTKEEVDSTGVCVVMQCHGASLHYPTLGIHSPQLHYCRQPFSLVMVIPQRSFLLYSDKQDHYIDNGGIQVLRTASWQVQ